MCLAKSKDSLDKSEAKAAAEAKPEIPPCALPPSQSGWAVNIGEHVICFMGDLFVFTRV